MKIFFTFIMLISIIGCDKAEALSTNTIPPSRTQPDQTKLIQSNQTPLYFTVARTESPTGTPSFTDTQMKAPTWTILPTLSDLKAENQLQSWLTINQGCLLPCWGGITPGSTSWQEAKQVLSATVEIEGLEENISCTFGPCNHISWRSRNHRYLEGSIASTSDNKIYWMIINGIQPIPTYRIDKILSQYGKPDKVFLHTNTFLLGPDDPALEITLSFSNNRFIIRYTWKAKINGGNVVGCIQDGFVYLDIKDEPLPWTDNYIKNEIYGVTGISLSSVKQLEEATEIDTTEFFDKFSKISGDECITTPVEYWR